MVAPFAGAWIEILCQRWISCAEHCRSLRGSVDWNNGDETTWKKYCVAPFAGAWIEINFVPGTYFFEAKSLPSRERGLKWFKIYGVGRHGCRSLRGSVDWNYARKRGILQAFPVAPFAGAWIEIGKVASIRKTSSCRSLRGSVDWNHLALFFRTWKSVAPFAGAWIEIEVPQFTVVSLQSLPSRERRLKSPIVLFAKGIWEHGLKF